MLNNNFESFDNSETSARKSALLQERVGLVSAHMYKQFLDYQRATVNTNEIFLRMIDNLQAVSETLKEAFSWKPRCLPRCCLTRVSWI